MGDGGSGRCGLEIDRVMEAAMESLRHHVFNPTMEKLVAMEQQTAAQLRSADEREAPELMACLMRAAEVRRRMTQRIESLQNKINKKLL